MVTDSMNDCKSSQHKHKLTKNRNHHGWYFFFLYILNFENMMHNDDNDDEYHYDDTDDWNYDNYEDFGEQIDDNDDRPTKDLEHFDYRCISFSEAKNILNDIIHSITNRIKVCCLYNYR